VRRSRFSQEQIIFILRERTPGTPVAVLCRKHGISRATFYRWRQQHARGSMAWRGRRSKTDAFGILPTASGGLAAPIPPVRPLPADPSDSIPPASLQDRSRPLSTGNKLVQFVSSFLGFREVEVVPEHQPADAGWGWFPHLTLSASLALIAIAAAYAGGQGGWPWATDLYWGALAALFFPVAMRAAWPAVSRRERIGLIVMLGMALYLVKVLQSPSAFIQFDELLHVPTAVSIFEKHHLFSLNSLLPISPLYPGMEIVTTAIAHLTGLSIFSSGVLLLAVVRVIVILSLFLLFEKISGSSWVASLACLIYMGNSGFLLFHSMFAYESLGLAFLVLVLLSEVVTASFVRYRAALFALTLPLLGALAVTHHATTGFAVALLLLLPIMHMACGSPKPQIKRAAVIGCLALAVSLGWSTLMGNPVEGYLAPVLKSGGHEFYQLLTGGSHGRKLFVGEDGSALPIWQRVATVTATLLACIALALGFFRTLGRGQPGETHPIRKPILAVFGFGSNARAALLTVLAIGFPASVLLRLTRAGWEVGNRLGAFVFLGVALVGAIAIVHFWLARSQGRFQAAAVGAILTVLFLGGAISGSAQTAVLTGYKVSADALSIEPLGVAAASWTKQRLGKGWRFAADRVNRLLLATYGRQRPVTTLQDRIDVSNLLLGDRLSSEDLNTITSGEVDFLLVDLRLSRALPLVGVYFETGEDPALHASPPSTRALLKFGGLPGVSRTFDNGLIQIYDVRSLHAYR
jgi:hypothetical protein